MLPHSTHKNLQPGDIQHTHRFGQLIIRRSRSNTGPEDYYNILGTLRTATIETQLAVIETCFPLWINLINRLRKTYQQRFFQILDAKESEFIPQVSNLLMNAILSVDEKRQRQIWQVIGPELENFIECWKSQTTT